MNTETVSIEQMNEAIALFEGYRVYDEGYTRCVVNNEGLGYPVKDLRYHESWSWIMPVYHRCRELIFIETSDEGCKLFAKIQDNLLFGTLLDFHIRIYRFIHWYNNQKQS
jgi:hypothetical protein